MRHTPWPDVGKLLLDQYSIDKPLFIFRHRIRVFQRGVVFKLDLYSRYFLASSIFDIYFTDYYRGEFCRVLIIRYNYEDTYSKIAIPEEEFPGFADAFLAIVRKEWPRLIIGPQPDALKWILAITALKHICWKLNPQLLGGYVKDEKTYGVHKNHFSEDWGAKTRGDINRLMAAYMNGFLESSWRNTLKTKEHETDALFADCDPRSFLTFGYHVAVHIAGLAYCADFLTYEEALNWCLLSCRRLQKLCSGWDDFYQCYSTGHSFQIHEDPSAPKADGPFCLNAYLKLKDTNDSMKIPWDTPLVRFWGSRGIVNEAAKPYGLPLFPARKASRSEESLERRLREPLLELSSFIEEGGHEIEDVEILAYCTLVKVFEITALWAKKEKKPLHIARSLATDAIARMLDFFDADIDIEPMIREYEESEAYSAKMPGEEFS
ncbi:MAG: DUF1266 domain-containing protein [Clostridiales bacterium]|nr:DUF1266 domain-containing protein [Clostridiales bacterium]